ncbi:MAG: large conductance mechanosensitive channel protein MscL [Candidatus Magasanikbacteria bacterium CG_4_9_14_0_2_um_filter_42_11]|uniref:Large-conductance mechanosensitive channel n=1 Tax=Candidatus Magasanikbacteria bacterium CG_4_9_14_0_2_um_filter_42_11 TaxID=1974643 RepID=A0A2M8F888_9BACT|nr:MAG: large conductance mechanosensitive channel protein MscL [Candidatus Magasanikbacteria bacterium CG10_big_fil_rev_8_21_14_0_10_43_9]PIY92897.1 MAG: large conductance mechanosensitive channel protein MscL [Candidatus Magasanikbacteria bacterium CG_4_10_14_0_8_um_filter_42_12]PJC51950.1 MAG: large conductance mechanosensitive channel protein MscL [Candidatus Magasanikbacteria bacterium CG_4_9_14_0_2_um_filter_42_11]
MKKFLEEFKSFAMRGNVVDLAIGVVIGASFGKIVTSLVNDIIMPPIGKLLGGVDFANLFLTLGGDSYDTLAAAQEAGAVTWNYGLFINTILNFIIVAFAIFILIKQMNKLKKKQDEEQAPPKISKQEELLTEIRDLLKQKTI